MKDTTLTDSQIETVVERIGNILLDCLIVEDVVKVVFIQNVEYSALEPYIQTLIAKGIGVIRVVPSNDCNSMTSLEPIADVRGLDVASYYSETLGLTLSATLGGGLLVTAKEYNVITTTLVPLWLFDLCADSSSDSSGVELSSLNIEKWARDRLFQWDEKQIPKSIMQKVVHNAVLEHIGGVVETLEHYCYENCVFTAILSRETKDKGKYATVTRLATADNAFIDYSVNETDVVVAVSFPKEYSIDDGLLVSLYLNEELSKM